VPPSSHLNTETDPISETFCSFVFLENQTMEKVQNPIILSVMYRRHNRFQSKRGIGTEECVKGTGLKRNRMREGGKQKNYRDWKAMREKREGNKDANEIKEIQ
jgi:hypothetical protein